MPSDDETTTIQVTKATRKRLFDLKDSPGESYNDVIRRLLGDG